MKFNIFAFFVVVIFFFSCAADKSEPVFSDDKSDIKAYNLIGPKEANRLLSQNPDKYIPIHVSKKEAFESGHIPNAINIWRPDYGSSNSEPYGGLIPKKEKLEELLQSFGFEEGDTLLLYDVKANVDAFRFAWVLNLYGFDHFKIINGGLKNWTLHHLEVSNTKTQAPEKSSFTLKEYFDDTIMASFEDVRNAIVDTNTILIDTRETYEYKAMPFVSKGAVLSHKKGAFNRGSIPSSIHLNWSRLTDLHGDHRIKSEKDLRHDLKISGIHPEKKIILYCHSGSRTSHTYYVLKNVLGFEHVKNYDGSWIEWSYQHSIDSTIPIEQFYSEEEFNELKDSLELSIANKE